MKSLTDIIQKLPELERCDSVNLSHGVVLITSGGFEDRTLAAANTVTKEDTGRAIVLNYRPVDTRNRLDDVIRTLENKNISIEDDDIIEFNRFNPEIFSSTIRDRFKQLQVDKVVLDVSAMSKLALLLCLSACRELNLDTTIFYAEAKKKGPSENEFEKARGNKNLRQPSIQVYTGIHSVVHVSGLSSVAMQGQPSAALVFMSFNELLTQSLINTVYPSRLFLINSRSPKWPWREKAVAWIHEQLRSEWQNSDNQLREEFEDDVRLPVRSVSTVDYRETVQVLLELYWQLSTDHRILLAPTGSKVQTLGCFIVKAMHPDIHIEYPTPNGFLETYSEGIGERWLIKFGRLKNAIDYLRMIERTSLLEINIHGTN